MSVTETLGSLGSWELQLSEATPDWIVNQLGFFGHVAICDGPVDVEAAGAGLLTGARYVGVLRAKDKSTGRSLSGSGMVFWLGDEDGKGDILETEVSLTAQTLAQCVTAIVDPSTAVDVGTVNSVAGTYTGKHQFQTRREALGIICDAFNVEFRVNGNGTVDVGTAAQLYNTAAPDTIVVRRGAGTDMDLVALGGDYTVDESVYDYSSRVVLLGQTVGSGDTADEVFATGSADAPAVPYLDLFGNPVKMVRTISESGTTTGSVTARAQLQLNRFNRVARSLKVTAEEYETEGNFVVGDNVYVYDPDTGIVNPAIEVTFRGEVLHPDIVRATGITWPVVQGMTVAFRTQAGVWLDLTPFVTWETGGNELTVGDLPKSLTKPGDNPVQVRLDASRGSNTADTSIPNPPTALTLATTSALNAKGETVAVINATWTAPALNTDGSVFNDLSHYLVRYRPQFRSPLWSQTTVTGDTAIDLLVTPSLAHDVQVAAVDIAGNVSAFTSTSSIISATDAIAPNPPADPVVTSYLGQLRIEYAGTDSTGNPMAADTNRIDVHVGTTVGFTATTATRVDSITPFAKGVSYATAPYGTTRYVRLIAVDHAGNASASSGVVSGATTQVVSADVFDGAIGTAKLADLAVTTAKINTLAVNDAKIGSVAAGKLTAGTMSADVVIGGRFATALTGARREVNAVGFQGWDASNNLTISLDGVNNLLTGKFQTALSGRRIETGASGAAGQMKFIAPDGTTSELVSFTATTGNEAIRMGQQVAGTHQWWNAAQVQEDQKIYLSSSLVSLLVGGDGAASEKGFAVRWIFDRSTMSELFRLWMDYDNSTFWHNKAGSTIFNERQLDNTDRTKLWIGNQRIAAYIDSSEFFAVIERVANGTLYNRFVIQSNDVFFQWPATNALAVFQAALGPTGFSVQLGLRTNQNYGVTARYVDNGAGGGHRLEFRDAGDTTYTHLWAASFVVSSSREFKNDIRPFGDDATALLRTLKVKKYRRQRGKKADEPDAPDEYGPEEIGFIAEELPDQLVARDENGVIAGRDVAQEVAAVIASLQQIDARLDKLEKGGKP